MKAFIVNVYQLFKLDTQRNEESNFVANKRRLLIPLYQREYKWTDDKIKSLVKDIERKDKFLGNIIFDETDDCYEIVDGQQRITTCFLLLLCIFNSYSGHPREQKNIEGLIKPYNGEYVLKNDTIGDFVTNENGVLNITIAEERDVYYQKSDFERAFNTISNFVNNLNSQNRVQNIKQKLLDCQFLILINDEHSFTRPVEQIFLDINEKAQLLEVEDIFKGHCFENFDEDSHQDLRKTWIRLKKCGMDFTKFGYEDLSQYIYLYLLEHIDSEMPQKLTQDGKHYLEGKSTDETEKLLLDMIEYGEAVVDFSNELNQNDYLFVDLCQDSYNYRNTGDHKLLKTICKEMLESPKAQYQKFPLMHFVHFLKSNNNISDAIKYYDFRKVIVNLYIYMSLFIIIRGGKKSKNDIDHSFYKILQESEFDISKVIDSAQKLRKDKVDTFIFKPNFEFTDLSFIYSVVDHYFSNANWLNNKYTKETGYNLEHFIIPNNRTGHITWKITDKKKKFCLPVELYKKYKKNTLNYLIMDKDLNGSMEDWDIVAKIAAIKEWFGTPGRALPKHMELIINYIESMQEYQNLKDLKDAEVEEGILESYEVFINAYFMDESQQELYEILQRAFKKAFSNE